MLTNCFFRLKIYYLNAGWIQASCLNNSINHLIYALWLKTKLIIFDRNLINLKKILIVIRNVINTSGFILFISSYFYYFKRVKLLCFSIKEYFLNNYICGYLSNYLYTNNFKSVPDLVLVFNFKRNIDLLKEIKTMGIPSAGIIDNSSLPSIIEYPIYLNQNSYFVSYLLLRLYSRYISLFKA